MIPLHLFANPVVLACLVAGMCAGMIAFGAGQFLPLYFQDSLFVSPTESGLRLLPQMLGVTIGTFGVGRLILWTGRYKIFPVVGTAVAAGGLFAIGHITGTTPYPWLVGPMIAMGFGIAAVFTTTSIATQNAWSSTTSAWPPPRSCSSARSAGRSGWPPSAPSSMRPSGPRSPTASA